MSSRVEVVPYDPAWPQRFRELATALRAALGVTASRIDHIGSTAVPGLDAKPIIDVQISVGSFDPLDAYRLPLERLGYVFRSDNAERTKATSGSRRASNGRTFTSGGSGAGLSSLPCSFATTFAQIRKRRSNTPR